MKKYKETSKKQYVYLGIICLLAGCAVLANLWQLLPLKYLYGSFHYGETVLIMFNDSYTGLFTFPFLLSFLLMVLTETEPNLFFVLTRFKSRREYLSAKYSTIQRTVLFYYLCICLFSLIAGVGSSVFGTDISAVTREYSKRFLAGDFATNSLIWEIVKIVILQGLLLQFFTMIFLVLRQLNLSQAMVFIIYTTILLFNAGLSLELLGTTFEAFSVYAIAGSVYNHGLSMGLRALILAAVDLFLLFLYFSIFEKKDIAMPKGNKQYQNE